MLLSDWFLFHEVIKEPPTVCALARVVLYARMFPRVIPCVVIGDGGVRRTRITRTVGVALVSPVLSSSGMVQCPVDPAGECEIFERSQFDIPAHIQVSGTGVVRILILYKISHRRILPCDIFVIDLAFLIIGIPQRESGEGAGKRVFTPEFKSRYTRLEVKPTFAHEKSCWSMLSRKEYRFRFSLLSRPSSRL